MLLKIRNKVCHYYALIFNGELWKKWCTVQYINVDCRHNVKPLRKFKTFLIFANGFILSLHIDVTFIVYRMNAVHEERRWSNSSLCFRAVVLYSIERSGNSFLFKSNVQILHLNQWIYGIAAIFLRLRFHVRSRRALDGLLRRHPSQKSSIVQLHYRSILR